MVALLLEGTADDNTKVRGKNNKVIGVSDIENILLPRHRRLRVSHHHAGAGASRIDELVTTMVKRSPYIQLALASGGKVWNLDGVKENPQVFNGLLAGEIIDTAMGVKPQYHYASKVFTSRAGELSTYVAGRFIDISALQQNNQRVYWEWDFDGDNYPDATGEEAWHQFEQPGEHAVRIWLTTEDDGKRQAYDFTVTISE